MKLIRENHRYVILVDWIVRYVHSGSVFIGVDKNVKIYEEVTEYLCNVESCIQSVHLYICILFFL